MAGTFTPPVRPVLAGAYFDWEAAPTATVPVSTGSIVAVVGTGDSGPVNTPVLFTGDQGWGAYRTLFGDTTSDLRTAVYQAFKGGRSGGAGAVVAYRQAGAARASATRTLLNTAGTPASAVTITGKYPGTRYNQIRVTVQAGVASGTKDLVVLDGLVQREKYTHTSTDLSSLVTQINALSQYVTATLVVDGTALADVSAQALSGGNDGSTLAGSDWTTTLAAIDAKRFGIFAPANLTDPTIRASVIAWLQARNANGARSLSVGGGGASELLSDGITRSLAINYWDHVNLGFGGVLHDDDLNLDLSAAQLAPRVAGDIANRGERKDLFFSRYPGLSVPAGQVLPSQSQQEQALAAGLTTFTSDRNDDAPVFIREGVTSYSDDSLSPTRAGQKLRPVSLWKRIKNLRIQHSIELEVTEWAESGDVIGSLPVNDNSRGIIIGRFKEAYGDRVTAEILQPGFTVQIDPGQAQTDDDDFIQVLHGFHPTRSLRQLLSIVRVG